MERMKALSRGSKVTLGASVLLLASLFFTWQNLVVDFGPAGTAVTHLDGWDVWGLLIGLTSLTLVALVVLRALPDIELPPNLPWSRVTLALGGLAFVLAVVKNLTDRDSAWASYGAVAIAGLVTVGTYLMWAETRPARTPAMRRRRGRIRSAA